MNLRTINSSDKSQLESLVLEFWGDHIRGKILKNLLPFVGFKDIKKVTKNQAQEFLRPEYTTYVIEDKGTLVAFIAGKINHLPDRVMDKAGYIENWYVTQEYRHKGVGKMLWDQLVKDFKDMHCTHLLLDTWGENTDARSLYTHKGFIEETVYMVKKLD